MYKAGKTQSEAESAWAVGSDYSRNLAESAAAALTNSGGSSINGRMTEAEYDAAMALVKKVRTEIKNQPLSEDLRKVYADGMKIIGAKPTTRSGRWPLRT